MFRGEGEIMPVIEGVLLAAEKAAVVTAEVVEKGVEVTAETAKEVSEAAKEAAKEAGKRVGEMIPEQFENLDNFKEAGKAVELKINCIRNTTPEQLMELLNPEQDEFEIPDFRKDDEKLNEKDGLSDAEKAKIKEETGWSDEITDAIGSMEEYQIYKDAGLEEAEINGKKCLIRNDIDWEQKDQMGRTNKERIEQGHPPINKDGNVIELHHIGQHNDSPLAELTVNEHRGKGNDTILHDKSKTSEIDRQAFTKERCDHWENRVTEGSHS